MVPTASRSTLATPLKSLRWVGLLLAAAVVGQVVMAVLGLYIWIAIEFLSEEGTFAPHVRPWLGHALFGAFVVGATIVLEMHRRSAEARQSRKG